MGLIYLVSGDTQSKHHSSRIVEPLLRWLWPSASTAMIETGVLMVRKGGHLTEYAILALLTWRALRLTLSSTPSVSGLFLRSMMIVVVYAASDEFHQTFVPQRYGSVVDVGIDATGAALGLGMMLLVGRWLGRRTRGGA
jgi:VanZ family protein